MSSTRIKARLDTKDLSITAAPLLRQCVTSLPRLKLDPGYLVNFAEHYGASAVQLDDRQFRTRFKMIALDQQWRFLNTWLHVGKLLLSLEPDDTVSMDSLELDDSVSMDVQIEVDQAEEYVAKAQPLWLDGVNAEIFKQKKQPFELQATLLDEGLELLKLVNSIALRHCESQA
jgi:hypothetical protein